MEIYAFDGWNYHLLNAMYAIGAVAVCVLLFFIIKLFVKQIVDCKKSQMKVPVQLTAIFAVAIIVPLVIIVSLSTAFFNSVTYETNMKGKNAQLLVGDVTVISCEEAYYRDTFMGYNVEIKVDGKVIAPSNAFPKEVIQHFEEDEELIIRYGTIDSDIYVWSIKTAKD